MYVYVCESVYISDRMVDMSVQSAGDRQHVHSYICIVVPYVARNKFVIVVAHYGTINKNVLVHIFHVGNVHSFVKIAVGNLVK